MVSVNKQNTRAMWIPNLIVNLLVSVLKFGYVLILKSLCVLVAR